jgi:hypothetical protein
LRGSIRGESGIVFALAAVLLSFLQVFDDAQDAVWEPFLVDDA